MSDGYVIVFDHGPEEEPTEEYYGYFSTPEEARTAWDMFSTLDAGEYRNVKLCKIVEDWQQTSTA